MIGSITAAYSYYSPYTAYRAQAVQRPQQAQEAPQIQGARTAGGAWTAQRAASPETPVQPVPPVSPVAADRAQPASLGLPLRSGADPAEMAVRMRIRPYDGDSNQPQSLSGTGKSGPAGNVGAAAAQEALEEGRCETCEKRKYQDGSDDMGVSFQTPTRVDPDMAAAAVRGHENEHVVREQAKAEREDRRVVSQSVTLHSDICPECGKVYISGGETRTTTAAKADPQEQQNVRDKEEAERMPFSVWG